MFITVALPTFLPQSRDLLPAVCDTSWKLDPTNTVSKAPDFLDSAAWTVRSHELIAGFPDYAGVACSYLPLREQIGNAISGSASFIVSDDFALCQRRRHGAWTQAWTAGVQVACRPAGSNPRRCYVSDIRLESNTRIHSLGGSRLRIGI